MNKVPSRFKMFGRTIRVVRSAKELEDDEVAVWIAESDRIVVHPDLPDALSVHTFCHEFCHAAFEGCGRDDLSEDEALVDVMAGLIHQMLTSAQ